MQNLNAPIYDQSRITPRRYNYHQGFTYTYSNKPPPQSTPPDTSLVPKQRGTMATALTRLSLGVFGLTLFGALFLFGVYPYVEAREIAQALNKSLPAAEIANQELLVAIQEIANYDLQQVDTEEQIGQIQTHLAQIQNKRTTLTNDKLLADSGQVAGERTTIYPDELAYDPEIEAQSQLALTANQKLYEARTLHEEMIELRDNNASLWVGEKLIDKLQPLTTTSQELLDEADAVVKFNDFSITLAKRTDDMLVAIDQAFLTGDVSVIANTIGDAANQMNELRVIFGQLKRPRGSEDLYNTVDEMLKISETFYNDLQVAIEQDDLLLFESAVNQFLVDFSSNGNRISDDITSFWQSLELGNLFDQWKEHKQTLLQEIKAVEASPLYNASAKIPKLF